MFYANYCTVEVLNKRTRRFLVSGIFCLVMIGLNSAFGQSMNDRAIYSEAPIVFENGIRKSNLITVKFKDKILDLPADRRTASITDMEPSFSSTITYFSQLQNRFGEIFFYKQIPGAKWCDVWRRNRRTGELVQIHDMSQLFHVKFFQFVPIDSIITELEAMDEVLYAHGPVQTVSLADPDDPCFTDISGCIAGTTGVQWNLNKIDAPKAWDITKGSSEIVIGIIEQASAFESGFVDRNHQDFILPNGESKFVPGLGDFGTGGGHATQVAGVAGAATNDGEGIASLGWDLKMIPYRFGKFDGDPDDPLTLQLPESMFTVLK